MYIPSEETKTMIHAIAAVATPSTLAALIVDLGTDQYPNDALEAMGAYAADRFSLALDQNVGTANADQMIERAST